jgi:hypothetical protein
MIAKTLEIMKPVYWLIIDTISISMSFALCITGFLVMNSELFLINIARDPPPSSWYMGLEMILLGIISYVLTLKSSQKFMQKIKSWNRIKNISALILVVLAVHLAYLNVLLYPPFHII